MKAIIAGILAWLGMSAQAAQEIPANESVIDDMRSMTLNITAEELGLTTKNYPNEVFGIIMETGIKNGSFTLLVLADGTTSLYFSNGSGIIGAGTHEKVREASLMLLYGANRHRSQTKPASSFPYPSEGEVKFYLIGRSGVTSYSAKEKDLGENRDPLSQLFQVSHMLISELRQVDELWQKK